MGIALKRFLLFCLSLVSSANFWPWQVQNSFLAAYDMAYIVLCFSKRDWIRWVFVDLARQHGVITYFGGLFIRGLSGGSEATDLASLHDIPHLLKYDY